MYIQPDDIRKSKNTIFIFGDNMEQSGYGGQAGVARQFVKEGKAFGIPTKRAPREDEDAYFSDRMDEKIAVRESFMMIRRMKSDGYKIVFFPNIGGGYADLEKHSPEIHGMIQGFIKMMGE